MAVTSTPIYPQAINSGAVSFVNADGAGTVNVTTNNKAVITAGTNGTKVEALVVGTNDSGNNNIYVTLYNGTSYFTIAEISIPLTGGYGANSIPTIDLLRSSQFLGLPMDAMGNRYLYLPTNWKLYVGMVSAVTAGKQTNVWAQGMDF